MIISLDVYFLLAIYNRNTNKDSSADQLIQSNKHLTEVRRFVVEELIAQNKIDKAKALLNEGIDIATKQNHKGLVVRWEKLLLQIAEMQNDMQTSRSYLERFAFESSFNKEYYKKSKNSFSVQEWPIVIENKITAIENNILKLLKTITYQKPDHFLLLSLGPIYVEEKMDNRLLKLVQNQTELHAALIYHAYLCKIFPEELIKIYLPLLESNAASCSERSDYKRLLQIVYMIIKDIPFCCRYNEKSTTAVESNL